MRFDMKMSSVALATAIALTVGVVWTNEAWAQDTPAVSESVPAREEVRQAALEAAAELLGMTPEELSDQLWGGKTLADLAEEANVELADVRAAVEAATSAVRQDRIEAFIAKQVENGRISQAQADWIMEGIENDWFGLRRLVNRFGGFGDEGFGLGGGHGFGRMRLHNRAVEPSE